MKRSLEDSPNALSEFFSLVSPGADFVKRTSFQIRDLRYNICFIEAVLSHAALAKAASLKFFDAQEVRIDG
ncbi:hypothetical protein [Pyramidobacter porci]